LLVGSGRVRWGWAAVGRLWGIALLRRIGSLLRRISSLVLRWRVIGIVRRRRVGRRGLRRILLLGRILRCWAAVALLRMTLLRMALLAAGVVVLV